MSLAEAREKADEARRELRDGRDPIRERQKRRRDAQRNLHLFRDIAQDAFEARKAELRGGGKAGRWFSPLELHVLPKLGHVPVAEITQILARTRSTLNPNDLMDVMGTLFAGQAPSPLPWTICPIPR